MCCVVCQMTGVKVLFCSLPVRQQHAIVFFRSWRCQAFVAFSVQHCKPLGDYEAIHDNYMK